MKAVITIGHESYLLKSDKSAATVLKAMEGAKRVLHVRESGRYPRGHSTIVLYKGEEHDVSLQLLSEKTRIETYKDAAEAEDLLGLPEHGQMLGLPEHGTRQD